MLRSIRFKFVVVYLLLILFSLELIGAYFVRTLTSSLIQHQTQTVQNQTQLMATLTAPQITPSARPSDDITSVVSSFPQFLNGSVYILNQDGFVMDTSAGGTLIGQKRADSIATKSLLQQKSVTGIRFDPISSQHLLAASAPMFNHGHFVGVVEYVVPIQDTYNTVRQVTSIFYTGSAVVLLVTIVLGIIMSRAITRPVLDVTGQARTMAAGDFSKRVEVRSDDELGDLASAINNLTEKLEQAIATSTREQERLQAIITSMGDGVITFDRDFKPVFMNQAAINMMPLPVGKEDDIASRLGFAEGQEDGEKAEQVNAVHVKTEKVVNQVLVKEIGQTLFHIHLTAIQGKKGVEGYVAVLRDVTEQEKLNLARRDFVANVSHELRTPLTSIKSYIEAVSDLDVDDDETRTKFLQVIGRETDRMVRLTRDLLLLSGLDTGKTAEVQYARFHVQAWIQAAIQRFDIQAQSKTITLSVVNSDDAIVEGNKDMLDRVLDNLLSNAFKYTPEGGTISVQAVRSNREVLVHVQDTGIGIPPQDLQHVFERFYRVDKGRSRRLGGTGLGLALAREITEQHGGTITIDSKLGTGTTVTVVLPTSHEGMRPS
jgi:two-component system, OmpR family, sensor histidine kinase VicK